MAGRELRARGLSGHAVEIVCVGVLIDTLVVRTLLVPALALILGDRFWWPHRGG